MAGVAAAGRAGEVELQQPKQKLSRKQRVEARKAARARDRAAGSDDEDAQLQSGSAFKVCRDQGPWLVIWSDLRL